MAEQKRPTTIQSVARASRILLAVSAEPSGLAAQEVAGRFHLTLSTAVHLLSTLSDEGLLLKTEGRRYVLGPAAGVIATAASRGLRPPAGQLAALDRLAQRTGETAYLTAWRLLEIRLVAHVEGIHAVRVAGLEVGLTGSIHARASGKLLLAFASAEVRDELLGEYEFTRHTAHTISNRDELQAELERIAADGYALDQEEFHEGVISAAAPIWHNDSVVAALSVSAPIQRFRENRGQILGALLEECAFASVPGSQGVPAMDIVAGP